MAIDRGVAVDVNDQAGITALWSSAIKQIKQQVPPWWRVCCSPEVLPRRVLRREAVRILIFIPQPGVGCFHC